MKKNEAIKTLINDGMSLDEAKTSVEERCKYYMRGIDGVSREYAEEMVIDEIEEIAE